MSESSLQSRVVDTISFMSEQWRTVPWPPERAEHLRKRERKGLLELTPKRRKAWIEAHFWMIVKWVISLHLKKWTEEISSEGGNSDDQGNAEERRAESEVDEIPFEDTVSAQEPRDGETPTKNPAVQADTSQRDREIRRFLTRSSHRSHSTPARFPPPTMDQPSQVVNEPTEPINKHFCHGLHEFHSMIPMSLSKDDFYEIDGAGVKRIVPIAVLAQYYQTKFIEFVELINTKFRTNECINGQIEAFAARAALGDEKAKDIASYTSSAIYRTVGTSLLLAFKVKQREFFFNFDDTHDTKEYQSEIDEIFKRFRDWAKAVVRNLVQLVREEKSLNEHGNSPKYTEPRNAIMRNYCKLCNLRYELHYCTRRHLDDFDMKAMVVTECETGMEQMYILLRDCYKIICELHHTITVMCSGVSCDVPMFVVGLTIRIDNNGIKTERTRYGRPLADDGQ
ncbi:hypothetical protein PRIPAC_95741 [Pristionchus pacificus]|uniref:Uncharacterized protein n=1 Tax=Pristionchus pacificus TaxID=54126 RepID=A0A2A6BIW4_PRIPA|nr:hypothetical protein PRIPAC_95741 [Pristionchus pacificus]|eukprot:PDM65766.1 hypothetical protein PRIPAC_45167 [Pristionchus pacificus]